MLGQALLLGGVLIVLPLLRRGASGLGGRQTPRFLLYFLGLGLGFMLIEISFVQKYVLLLGYPTYSLSVTLASMLAFTGIGSWLSTRYLPRYRTPLAVLIGVIVLATLFYGLAMDAIVAAALPTVLSARVLLAMTMLLPLGVCLGGFMPIGLSVAAAHTPHREEYVAWGWAVNGFFSVISSIMATVLSMTLGFTAVMYLALALYLIAAGALLAIPRAVHSTAA
jgi:MFS family permease